ncbi:erv26 super protein [Coemansia sp. RSA 552]|nr:erv26 super protein [Coemansia sp. RSA 552]
MAVLLGALSSASWALGLLFVVFSLACGLYVISEWVEEYPRQARRLIQLTVWVVDAVHVAAVVDGLSVWRAIVSVAANHLYAMNLDRFPLVQLTGPVFLSSCVLAVSNHFLWFFYFIRAPQCPFDQVCTFMFFGVWLVPLALFVSLTPQDAALPSAQTTGAPRGKSRQNFLRAAFSRVRQQGEQLPQTLHSE